MNNISFSSNNVNNRINSIERKNRNKSYVANNFKCNTANNKIEIGKRTVVLGERVSLWR